MRRPDYQALHPQRIRPCTRPASIRIGCRFCILAVHRNCSGEKYLPGPGEWWWVTCFGCCFSCSIGLASSCRCRWPRYFHCLSGLVILQVACQVLVTATERFAARMGWSHYLAGTVAEILATLPECVVIAFVIPISPLTAFVLAMVTIYNNALVFSIYSYFLPRDQRGKFLMPEPITDAGTQVLIAGGALGLVLGLTMLVFSTNSEHPKGSFNPIDLTVISVLLLAIFAAYLFKLLKDLSLEEEEVHSCLN